MTARLFFSARPDTTPNKSITIPKYNPGVCISAPRTAGNSRLLPATGASARTGVLISARLAVRSMDNDKDASATGFRHAPNRKTAEALLPTGYTWTRRKQQQGTIQETGQRCQASARMHHARRRQGKNWELERYRNKNKYLRPCRRTDLPSETITSSQPTCRAASAAGRGSRVVEPIW